MSLNAWSGQNQPVPVAFFGAVTPCRRKTQMWATSRAMANPGRIATWRREEARQGVVAVFRPADDHFLLEFANHGHVASDVRRHLRGVIALLVPRQQIAGQAQAEDDAHQAQAEPPVDFARRQMGPRDDDLQHVHAHQHDHCLRAEVMQAADEPAEIHLVLDEVNAVPGLRVAGAVRRHQQHAGDELDREDEDEDAAPDVAPLRAAGNVFQQQRVDEPAQAGAVVHPVAKGSNHVRTSLVGLPW